MGRRVQKVSLLGVLFALGWAVFGIGQAAAGGPPPAPGLSAVWQYTEAVPTSKGPALEKGARSTPAKLPPKAEAALAQSSSPVDHVLRDVATSPRDGAPAGRRATHVREKRAQQRAPRVSSAPVGASSAGYAGDMRFIVIVALMGGGLLSVLGFRLLARRPPLRRPRR